MINFVRKFVALACFAIALSSGVFAQDLLDTQVKANVPFDFYAGDIKLPAGDYTFKVSEEHRITLRNQATGRTYWLMSKPADPSHDNQVALTFDVAGGTYILHSLESDKTSIAFYEKAPVPATLARSSVRIIAAGN